ncbi:MAG: hypothetical protein A2Z14_06990 [Chloroflexi bacterium RBG_16_48_8]|nr:MAG: hypothetical protein A2Z14_06990 [Chloroflexi bacterium RBG_16_48_8]
MDVGSLLVIFALAIIVVGYILRPLIEKRAISVTENSRYASELQAERDQVLMNLQEFDIDHAMGKIPADEYQGRRAVLVARGAAILKELDRLDGIMMTAPARAGEAVDQEDHDFEAQIEKEIQRRRRSVKEETAGYCPQCGNKLQSGDRFCTSCGFKVHVAESEA